LEEKKDFPNCPYCAEPGELYHPIEYQFEKKSLSFIDLLKEAAKDFID
jgi:hypothetical protein